MELKKATSSYQLSQVLMDKTFEQTVESDFILPDYLAEIVRIVKCMGTPRIVSKQTVDGKVILDGYVQIDLLYTSEDGEKLYSFEQAIPFTKQIDCKTTLDGTLVETSVKGEYINCRATNPRAIAVRSSVSIRVKVTGESSQNILSDVSGSGIQLKKESFTATSPVAQGQKMFSLEDEAELGTDIPVASVIGVDSQIAIDDYKIITGKVILKGEAKNHVTYLTEENTVISVNYTIPVSQIIDIDGCEAEMEFSLRSCVLDCKAELKQNIEGENTILATQMLCEASVVCYENHEIDTIRDIFSTTHESEFQTKGFSASRSTVLPKQQFSVNRQVNLDGGEIAAVYDVWADANILNSKIEDGQLLITGSIKATILAIDEAEGLTFSEKNIDFDQKVPAPVDAIGTSADISVKIKDIGFTVSGDNQIDLRFDLEDEVVLTTTFTGNVVDDIAVNEDAPKSVDKDTALTIYYCDPGEDVWQIAKRFNTSVEAIIGENSLEGDTVADKRTLLIPIVTD